MKYLGKVEDVKDLTTKEYVDDKFTEVVPSTATSTNKLTTNSEVDSKITTAIGNAIAASY